MFWWCDCSVSGVTYGVYCILYSSPNLFSALIPYSIPYFYNPLLSLSSILFFLSSLHPLPHSSPTPIFILYVSMVSYSYLYYLILYSPFSIPILLLLIPSQSISHTLITLPLLISSSIPPIFLFSSCKSIPLIPSSQSFYTCRYLDMFNYIMRFIGSSLCLGFLFAVRELF